MAIWDRKSLRISLAFLFSFFASALPNLVNAQSITQGWSGTYKYEENLGYDGGGTSSTGETAVIDFTLNIQSSGKCTLTAEGYQTDEAIVCGIEKNTKSIIVTFKSYKNGSIVNQYGVAEYKPNEVLFVLGKTGSRLTTTWKSYNNDPPLPAGIYFKEVSSD